MGRPFPHEVWNERPMRAPLIHEVSCTSALELLDQLAPTQQQWLGSGGQCVWWFRGQSDAAWELSPSAMRPTTRWIFRTKSSGIGIIDGIASHDLKSQLEVEHAAFLEFVERCNDCGLPIPEDSGGDTARRRRALSGSALRASLRKLFRPPSWSTGSAFPSHCIARSTRLPSTTACRRDCSTGLSIRSWRRTSRSRTVQKPVVLEPAPISVSPTSRPASFRPLQIGQHEQRAVRKHTLQRRRNHARWTRRSPMDSRHCRKFSPPMRGSLSRHPRGPVTIGRLGLDANSRTERASRDHRIYAKFGKPPDCSNVFARTAFRFLPGMCLS